MEPIRYADIVGDGLWRNNPGFVQLLGLCPLLAVSGTVVNAIGLGVATLLTLMVSNIVVSAVRRWIPREMRIPVFVLVIASSVTVIELAMRAWFFELHGILGIFIPLIVTNCVIIARAEAFAVRHEVLPAALDGFFMGLGFTLVLILLGSVREVLAQGTLFAQAALLFGDGFEWLTITLVPDYRGLLLAALPPGAFIGLGLLVALRNLIEQRRQQRTAPVAEVAAPLRDSP